MSSCRLAAPTEGSQFRSPSRDQTGGEVSNGRRPPRAVTYTSLDIRVVHTRKCDRLDPALHRSSGWDARRVGQSTRQRDSFRACRGVYWTRCPPWPSSRPAFSNPRTWQHCMTNPPRQNPANSQSSIFMSMILRPTGVADNKTRRLKVRFKAWRVGE
jgi:hypothetical protein